MQITIFTLYQNDQINNALHMEINPYLHALHANAYMPFAQTEELKKWYPKIRDGIQR